MSAAEFEQRMRELIGDNPNTEAIIGLVFDYAADEYNAGYESGQTRPKAFGY